MEKLRQKISEFIGAFDARCRPVLADRTQFVAALKTLPQKVWESLCGLSMRARVISALALAICAGLLFWNSVSKATLLIRGQHPFRAAELSVFEDDSLVFSGMVHGRDRSNLAVFHKVQGSFSEEIPVSTGRHTIRVRLKSDDGFDESEQLQAVFSRHQQRTLRVDVGRGGGMYLQWASRNDVASVAAPIPAPPEHRDPLLLTILGSSVSAFMAWFIPNMLKALKTVATPPAQAQIDIPASPPTHSQSHAIGCATGSGSS